MATTKVESIKKSVQGSRTKSTATREWRKEVREKRIVNKLRIKNKKRLATTSNS
ncbi:MAG: hypothetical protein AAF717_01160 [Bacteroidota bacterium]